MVPSRTLPTTLSRSLLFAAILCLFTSCATLKPARDLREAQDQFNRASELENELTLNLAGSESIRSGQSIASGYATSLSMVTYLIDKKKTNLGKNNLLGTAYTLKALSEWRLGDFRGALSTADVALANSGALFPRDQALLMAIPGLVKNDSARQNMASKTGQYDKTVALLSTSIEDIGRAISDDPALNHIRLYLLTAQLASLKNWTDLKGDPAAYGMTRENSNSDQDHATWCKQAQPVWEAFDQEVVRLGSSDVESIKQNFKSLLSLPVTCEDME